MPGKLLLAAAKEELKAVAAVLDADASLLDRAGPHPYWGGSATALHLAAEGGRVEIVGYLLSRGANPNPDGRGYDDWTPLQIAIHRERARVVEVLLAGGAELTIWAAAALGRVETVERLAAEANSPGSNAATPLQFASTVAVAECLLAHAARLDARDKYGRTPAEAVASYGSRYRECGLFLTAQAGDMNLERAVALGEIDVVKRLFDPAAAVLPTAALHGHTAIVAFLLERGSDPNAGFPLHQAARNGHVEAARLLLAHGADPQRLDEWHQSTPLDWAEFHGQEGMAAFLRDRLK